MALRQKIDPLKFLSSFVSRNASNVGSTRYSLLDATILLLINEHPKCSKADLTEFLYGERNAMKSSLDRPLLQLVASNHVAQDIDMTRATKSGVGRSNYSLTKTGRKFLQKCSY